MTDTDLVAPRHPRNTALETLIMTFAVFRDCGPLVIGIHKAIHERLPGLGTGRLRQALKIHTASTRYLKALSRGGVRFELDGNATGIVTPEQQRQALETLRERFRRQADQRKAELQAQEHRQKLLKLVEIFNSR